MDINERDFRGLDLNLLLVFNALLKERNVTRAAQRLFIGQPAASAALQRLRVALGDELFVRTSHGMEPTGRALELAASIGPLLQSLQQTLSKRSTFDPGKVERVFRIGLSDSLEVALMPKLMRHLAAEAPGVRLISSVVNTQTAGRALDTNEVELAISVARDLPAWQRQCDLFSWTFVCLFDPQQVKVRGKRMTTAEYLRYPHVITSFNAGLSGFMDEQLAQQKLARRVVFSSPHFATSPLLLKQMPAIATVPTFIAATWRDALGLRMSPVPVAVPTYKVEASWTAAYDADAGVRWLASVLRRCSDASE